MITLDTDGSTVRYEMMMRLYIGFYRTALVSTWWHIQEQKRNRLKTCGPCRVGLPLDPQGPYRAQAYHLEEDNTTKNTIIKIPKKQLILNNDLG